MLARSGTSEVDRTTLYHRPLNLRLRGEVSGGLPRLERNYDGRGAN
jgi:hypothetical protein